MSLAILIGLGAFITLGVMFALLWASGKREEREDTITQDMIARVTTGMIKVHIKKQTQEKED